MLLSLRARWLGTTWLPKELFRSGSRREERKYTQANGINEMDTSQHRGCLWWGGFVIGILAAVVFVFLWQWHADNQVLARSARPFYEIIPCLVVFGSVAIVWKNELVSGTLLIIEAVALILFAVTGDFVDWEVEALGVVAASFDGFLLIIAGTIFVSSWEEQKKWMRASELMMKAERNRQNQRRKT